jgi:hypothetical protein
MKNLFTLVFALLTLAAQAQFTANNIAVLKITSPTTIGNVGIAYTTRIVEYTPAGVATATNINLTGGTPNFVVEERAVAHEGQLNLSTDGRYLTAVGYNAAPGGTATAIRALDKRIARIDGNGKVDLSTSVKPVHSFGGVGVRSAITDDGSVYLVNSSAAGAPHGVRSVTHGEDTSVVFTLSQYRSLGKFGGVVYGSSLNSTKMFSHSLSGAPTELTLGGLRAGTEYTQFVFMDVDPNIPGNDLLYIADRNSGIRKLFLNGITWTPVSDSSGVHNPNFGGASGFFALTGRMEGGKPTLYGIKINVVNNVYSSSHLIKIVDNSARNADWNLTANAPTSTQLAFTDDKEQLKGVAFVPRRTTSTQSVSETKNQLIIKPTLVENAVTIVLSNEVSTRFGIFNIAGQQVLSATGQGEHTLNVSELPVGLYLVRTATGATGRFIKQ